MSKSNWMIFVTYEYSIAGITTIELLYSANASFSAASPPSIVLWSLKMGLKAFKKFYHALLEICTHETITALYPLADVSMKHDKQIDHSGY